MVPFTFNTYGFAFEKGVELIADAYRVASDALEAKAHKIKSDLAAYEASISAGGEVIGEWEDGYWLWTQDQLLEIQIEDSEEALNALRRAFVVALYHHWERWLRRQFAKDSGKHDDLVGLAAKYGLHVHPRLEGVRDLANLLKHSNNKRGHDLLGSWRELLPPHFTLDTRADWYEAVKLTDEVVLEVVGIVKASGPHIDKAYRNPVR